MNTDERIAALRSDVVTAALQLREATAARTAAWQAQRGESWNYRGREHLAETQKTLTAARKRLRYVTDRLAVLMAPAEEKGRG